MAGSLSNSPQGQWLTKGRHSIRVRLRGNSVVGTGRICMLTNEPNTSTYSYACQNFGEVVTSFATVTAWLELN